MKVDFQRYLWALALSLALAGCRAGVPDSEYDGMHKLQAGWVQILEGAEQDFEQKAMAHVHFMSALHDTSNYARTSMIRQDSSLRIRIRQVEASFGRASRRHLYNIKALRSFLDLNETWMVRVRVQGLPPRTIRGSWESRTNRFEALYAAINTSAVPLQSLKSDYDALERRLQLGPPVIEAALPQ